ncbi:MAG: adenylosuccinate synthase [Firmicutes bacterium]|nr:adenylosuccinate synthase [Bacillota bacterium]
MPGLAVVGAQWGDEGKGKIVDYLAAQADMVVRYAGGNNAGHTVVAGGRTVKLHLVPSGILYPGVTCVIGNGVVIDPEVLVEELDALEQQGMPAEKLRISNRAHLLMPYHRDLDRLEEEARGSRRLGTTGRGVGPAYVDKAAREGVRLADLADEAWLRERLAAVVPRKSELLRKMYGHPGYTVDEMFDYCLRFRSRLVPLLVDAGEVVGEALERGQRILFEGAQGTMLDLDHGTYPYVTSSTATAGGVLPGTGVGPGSVSNVLGVVKAYTTRVGMGPFPTELSGEQGEWLRQRGGEFGTTTGRPRRCGWLDLVQLRYAVRINGIRQLALTKLDVLSGLERVRMAVAYEIGGRRLDRMPASLSELAQVQPVYEELPGWSEPLASARALSELPEAARRFIGRLEELLGIPVVYVSVGPGREQTIAVDGIAW